MATHDDLAGAVAIVTGAGSGIGRATARALDARGVLVFAADIDLSAAEASLQDLSVRARAFALDVRSPQDWAGLANTIREDHGRLDILVNNAGVMINAPFLETSLETFRAQNAINVEGVFLGMQTAIPLMLPRKPEGPSASIVNVSSVYGQVAGASFSGYSASKGAVRALTKAVAREFADKGVRVNSIHPGPTATNLGAGWAPPRDAEGRLLTPEEALRTWTDLIPMGRLGAAEEMADAITFLCSAASRYMTGSELVVDGGYIAV